MSTFELEMDFHRWMLEEKAKLTSRFGWVDPRNYPGFKNHE